jgi:hypothetical protein
MAEGGVTLTPTQLGWSLLTLLPWVLTSNSPKKNE